MKEGEGEVKRIEECSEVMRSEEGFEVIRNEEGCVGHEVRGR